MDKRGLLAGLLETDNPDMVEQLVDDFIATHRDSVDWLPIGGKPSNRGPIEVSSDAGRALIERITNGIDAILELEYEKHQGHPSCSSPREAALAWLGVPSDGLSGMSLTERQRLANLLAVTIFPGTGKEKRTIDIQDRGIGIDPHDMSHSILGLHEGNKMSKRYLVGVYGQGGSSTFVRSDFTLIATRRYSSDRLGFTIVKYLDTPPEEMKTGYYVYLALDDSVLVVQADEADFSHGTLVRHFGYDLSKYAAGYGSSSVYGLMQQMLFDSVMPVWLDNRVHGWRRVIKGSRNALNGAVDDDEDRNRGPRVIHKNAAYTELSSFGRIHLEYWVLVPKSESERCPIRGYVNERKAIILTLNGQAHAELSTSLTRKECELPFLASRLICHVNCDSLTPTAKRALFISSREGTRSGLVHDALAREVINALRSDPKLAELNAEIREHGLTRQDESARNVMRRDVARLLQLPGRLRVHSQAGPGVDNQGVVGPPPSPTPRPTPPPPPTIELHDPPTFIRIKWPGDASIRFYSTQRRYISIETDAPDEYYDPKNPNLSRINLVAANGAVAPKGGTLLQGGRMRGVFEAFADCGPGETGLLGVELSRPGLPMLSDEREYETVERPPTRPRRGGLHLPDFEVVGVEGPESHQWRDLGWPEAVEHVASQTVHQGEKLWIYYSRAFPAFIQQRGRVETRDTALAASYEERYKTWIAAHALIVERDKEGAEMKRLSDDAAEEVLERVERLERCRFAALAAMYAMREVFNEPMVVEAMADA